MKDASFGIYIPSYKRAKTCITHKWLDNYRYVVRKSEEKDYIAAGIPEIERVRMALRTVPDDGDFLAVKLAEVTVFFIVHFCHN